jgi:hypothetical protein
MLLTDPAVMAALDPLARSGERLLGSRDIHQSGIAGLRVGSVRDFHRSTQDKPAADRPYFATVADSSRALLRLGQEPIA